MPGNRVHKCARRKASAHVRRISTGNKALKKSWSSGFEYDSSTPPQYLHAIAEKYNDNETDLTNFYDDILERIWRFGRLDFIPPHLVRRYVIANYKFLQANRDFMRSKKIVIDVQTGKPSINPIFAVSLEMMNQTNKAWKPIKRILFRHKTPVKLGEWL